MSCYQYSQNVPILDHFYRLLLWSQFPFMRQEIWLNCVHAFHSLTVFLQEQIQIMYLVRQMFKRSVSSLLFNTTGWFISEKNHQNRHSTSLCLRKQPDVICFVIPSWTMYSRIPVRRFLPRSFQNTFLCLKNQRIIARLRRRYLHFLNLLTESKFWRTQLGHWLPSYIIIYISSIKFSLALLVTIVLEYVWWSCSWGVSSLQSGSNGKSMQVPVVLLT